MPEILHLQSVTLFLERYFLLETYKVDFFVPLKVKYSVQYQNDPALMFFFHFHDAVKLDLVFG